MKYSIDKIENNIVLLEDIDSGLKKEVSIDLLPVNVVEGNIVLFENNRYIFDFEEEKIRRKRILDKFSRLKKK